MAITGNTGANHILPGMLATLIAGGDVVQGKLAVFLAAVLTGIPVAAKDLKASEPSLWSGTFNQV